METKQELRGIDGFVDNKACCGHENLRGAKEPTVEFIHALASLHEHMSLTRNSDLTETRVCSKISKALTFTQPKVEARSMANTDDELLSARARVLGINENARFYT